MDQTASTEQGTFTSKLKQMSRQPFGVLEDGSPMEEIKASLVITAIEYMQSKVREATKESLPATMSDAAREKRFEDVASEAVDRLVAMLNQAIPDVRYHVTSDYLLDEGHNYSTEFWLFVVDYCRVICRDPDFYVNHAQGRVPRIIAAMFRPLSAQSVFQLIPKVASKFANTDIRAVEVTSTTARLRWYGHRQDDPALSEIHLAVGSGTLKGMLASVPLFTERTSAARVRETVSMLDGSDYYEWEFAWENPPRLLDYRLVLGVVISAGLLVSIRLLNLPAVVLAIPAILLPLYVGWSLSRFNRLEYDYDMREGLLQEQRKLFEDQYDESQQAKAQLQNLNIELKSGVDELTALHEVGAAISTTLDLDELLERTLMAVHTYLHFDRAIVMIADYERGVLTRAKGVDVSPEMVEFVSKLEFSLADSDNHFIDLLNADEPILLSGLTEDATETNRQLYNMLGVREHLGTPLITKQRRVGILAVDNNISGRPITEEDAALIFTVAGQIAVAIENALLYREVEAQKKTLEQRVERRTVELAQAVNEAQEARAIAEDASEAKSSFLSSVSHELRTPLTSVLGFAKIIQRDLERHIFPLVDNGNNKAARARENVREEIGIIITEGQRLTSMINDVLDLAKIEAGQLGWKEQSLNITEVIDRAVKATASLVKQDNLEVIVKVSEELPAIIGDEDRLMQVMLNLLSNAVKFTEAGEIVCYARQIEEEVVVSVSDTGIGIAEEDVPKVFEKFRQVGDTLTEKPRGTGLGLPICKEIIQHHGGRIWVESELGEGSTFSFALPVNRATV